MSGVHGEQAGGPGKRGEAGRAGDASFTPVKQRPHCQAKQAVMVSVLYEPSCAFWASSGPRLQRAASPSCAQALWVWCPCRARWINRPVTCPASIERGVLDS